METKMQKIIIGGIIILLLLVGGLYFKGQQPVGSVTPGGEYKYLAASSTPTDNQVVSGPGALGSVIVTKAGAAGSTWSLYDATSTNINLTTKRATTTIVTFQTDATAGTYTFDVSFYDGLLFDPSGSMGSSTVTFRGY